ncbi:hypothetical protein JRC61_14070 [Streptomyces sp. CL12-4]|nr:hypothetical protein [Streptomyces sp. CL12-4]
MASAEAPSVAAPSVAPADAPSAGAPEVAGGRLPDVSADGFADAPGAAGTSVGPHEEK